MIDIMENTKIKGWVARNDFYLNDDSLRLFFEKPQRDGNYGWKSFKPYINLRRESFRHLRWQDEPIEVELTIKPI